MLINIFGIEIKKNMDEEIPNETIYAKRTVSGSTENMINKSCDNLNSWNEKASLPLWIEIIKYIAMFLAICITLGILKADVSISEAFENGDYLFFIGGICWIILIAIIIYNSKLKKKIGQNEKLSEDLYDFENIAELARKELKIPENADSIDVLGERYKIKNNEIKHVDYPMFSYINFYRYIYVQNGMLCIANLYSVIEFPVSAIVSITPEKKKATFPEWHKDIPLNDKSLKKYKILTNNQGSIITKYYKVTVKTVNRDFYFLIPNYDIELFCNITNTHIDEITL